MVFNKSEENWNRLKGMLNGASVDNVKMPFPLSDREKHMIVDTLKTVADIMVALEDDGA